MFMFTDGGPDHNCKHLSVQAALLALFLIGGMDTMVVLRTTPQQSWTKPAERGMSVLNLGLQGCALARTEMDKEFEVTMRKCNGMSALHRAAEASQSVAKAAQERQTQGQVLPSAQEEMEVNMPSSEQAVDALVNIPTGPDATIAEEHAAIHNDMRDANQTSDANQPTNQFFGNTIQHMLQRWSKI